MNLGTLLEMSAVAMPDRPAISFNGETLTYPELLALARRWARSLDSFTSSSIAVIGENHVGVIAALLGAALCGCNVAVLNPRLKEHELVHAIRTTQARALFTSGVRSDAPGRALSKLDFDVALLDLGREPPIMDHVRSLPTSAEAGALYIFTSGTTSLPKAVVLRQELLIHYLFESYEPLSASPSEATLVAVPLFHIAGVMNALSAIYCARRIVLMPRFDPDEWLATAVSEGVTQAFLVPTMLRRVVALLRDDPNRLPQRLRLIAYGGAPSTTRDVHAAVEVFPGVDFVAAFGLTETSSTIAVLTPDDHRRAMQTDKAELLTSVGRPIPGVEIAIEHEGGAPDAVPGQDGEILVRGRQVSGVYAGGTSRVDTAGWLHTGDVGHFDAEGYLYVVGRVDDMIQRGAENISPREVELAFELHPDILETAALGVPDPDWGEIVALVIVGREGTSIEPEELRRFAQEQLASFKRPQLYAFADALPRNALGKVLRAQLRASLLDAANSKAEPIHPSESIGLRVLSC